MEVDPARYLVRVADRRVQLTFMEFHILVAIAEQAGRVASYEALMQRFWGHRRTATVAGWGCSSLAFARSAATARATSTRCTESATG